MKNLLIQNWHCPDLPEIALASIRNIRTYATRIGAAHRVLSGTQFHPEVSTMCQQLLLLNEEFDEWDNVAHIDCDMFAVKGLTEDLFAVPGHGFHQEQAHARVCRALPKLTSTSGGFYGGCLYKFNREERRRLRAVVNIKDLLQFDCKHHGHDEGMLHRLCLLANLPASYFPDLWCYGNYWPQPERAKIVHVRCRPSPDKMTNLRALQAKGIL